MRLILSTLLLAGAVIAADQPKPDARDAEIAALKAQVALLQVELQIATLPEVMRARLVAMDAQSALKAAQNAAKPKE